MAAKDRDTALELADLTRQLATARSLLTYEQTCHTTTRLDAAESQRQQRVRLIHLEPSYALLLSDYNNEKAYSATLEKHAQHAAARIAELEEDSLELGAVKRQLEITTEAHREQLRGLFDQDTVQGAREEEQMKELGEMNVRCRELEDEVAGLYRDAKAAQSQARKAEKDHGKLSDEHKKLTEEHKELQSAHKDLEKTHKDLEKTHKDLEKTLHTQTTALSTLTSEHASAKALITDLTASKTTAHTTLAAAESKAAAELADARATIAAHKTELHTLEAKLQDHVDRLAKALTSKAATKVALESELATLRLELRDAQEDADDARAARNEVLALEKQLASLRAELDAARKAPAPAPAATATAKDKDTAAALKRETKLREKAESELAALTAQHATILAQLESTRAKLAKAKKVTLPPASSAATAADDSKKRPAAATTTLTMADLEHSAKRPRKEGPKVSDFSITPFLRKTAAVVSDDPSTPTGGAGGETMAGMETESSVVVPAVVESSLPTRMLLAGAARKRKAAAQVEAPVVVEEEAPSPEPELVKRKGKKPVVEKVVEREREREVGIFDSPSSLPVPVKARKPVEKKPAEKKPAEKKEKAVAAAAEKKEKVAAAAAEKKEKSKETKEKEKEKEKEKPLKGKGIMPTVFDEDDGTGRLVMNIEAQEKEKGKGKGLGLDGGDAGLMLVPVVSAFNRDISPAKKRPDALKKLFAGKKK